MCDGTASTCTSFVAGLGENSLHVTVDCISKPVSNYANIIVSGITKDVALFDVHYSCETSNGTVSNTHTHSSHTFVHSGSRNNALCTWCIALHDG